MSTNTFPIPIPTAFSALPDDALIRLYAMMAWGLVPFSSSTLWRKCRTGEFPAPLKVSNQITAWRVGDVRRWLKSPADFSPELHHRKAPLRKSKRSAGRSV